MLPAIFFLEGQNRRGQFRLGQEGERTYGVVDENAQRDVGVGCRQGKIELLLLPIVAPVADTAANRRFVHPSICERFIRRSHLEEAVRTLRPC